MSHLSNATSFSVASAIRVIEEAPLSHTSYRTNGTTYGPTATNLQVKTFQDAFRL
ncbi:hypothetical protein M378DRAFT_159703 [Amanita muscaria Koide BX008]|uniref:Uncharacterized protein n=1 Tax=Amanita muscaria (strain Koide BX008) TaxID=946122 RepID=A0A0C2XCY2_AMAMK|nr:hypothetical protein M378DRAFT_159703 [Amanita muscaria Koide BX008]